MRKKYKIILAACVVSIFCVSLVKFYFISEQEKRIVMLQKTLAAARNNSYLKADKLPEKQVEKNVEKEQVKAVLDQVPEEFLFTEYASNIRGLVDRNRLTLNQSLVFKHEKIKGSNTEGIDGLIQYATRLSVTGKYSRIRKLIADLQNLNGLVIFESLRLKKDKSGRNSVRMDMDLSVIFKKDIQ